MQSTEQVQLIEFLLSRLERVSVDSYWAHRASGIRGALLKVLEMIEAGKTVHETRLSGLTEDGFRILRNAAKERA
jgi:hypothetical protein